MVNSNTYGNWMTIEAQIQALPEAVSVSEVSGLLRVDPKTIRNWIVAGKLDAVRLVGQYRISRDALLTFIKQ